MNATDKADVKDAVKLGVMEGMQEHYNGTHKPLNDQIATIRKTIWWGSGLITAIGMWLKLRGQ